jgi:hypothetical protein
MRLSLLENKTNYFSLRKREVEGFSKKFIFKNPHISRSLIKDVLDTIFCMKKAKNHLN